MLAERKERKRIVENIFRTMEYNENQAEDFSTILKWLTEKNFTLNSTIEVIGTKGSAATNIATDAKFSVLGKDLTVSFLKPENLHLVLGNQPSEESLKELDAKEKEERLVKLQKAVEGESTALCLAESIGSQVPLWQIKEHEKPKWSHQTSSSNEITWQAILESSPSKKKVILVQLSHRGHSTTTRILKLLKILVQTDQKILVLIDAKSSEDLRCLIPAAYLIEAVNKFKIRNSSIEILYIENSLEVLESQTKFGNYIIISSQGMLLSQFQHSVPLSGVLTSKKQRRCVQWIVDSSVDLPATVDTISNDMWCSGPKVNSRERVTLFVHQPVYESIIQLFSTKLQALKLGDDVRNKTLDFIKRTSSFTQEHNRLVQEGINTFPSNTDFSGPSLVYNVGTSSEFMTTSTLELGHVLSIIPYRSVSELFALANTQGEKNEVHIYSSNASVLRQIISGIKGSVLTANQVLPKIYESKHFHEEFFNSLYLRSSSGKQDTQLKQPVGITSSDDEYRRATQEAEKRMKTWSCVKTGNRLAKCIKVMDITNKLEGKIYNENERIHDIVNLVAAAELSGNGSTDFLIEQHSPFGVTGIVISDTENFVSWSDILMPVLITILKGNVAIVVFDSPQTKFSKLSQMFESLLSSREVQFLKAGSSEEAVTKLSAVGKVQQLWILQSELSTTELSVNPEALGSFSKVFVDNAVSLRNSIVSRAKNLEISKEVYF